MTNETKRTLLWVLLLIPLLILFGAYGVAVWFVAVIISALVRTA